MRSHKIIKVSIRNTELRYLQAQSSIILNLWISICVFYGQGVNKYVSMLCMYGDTMEVTTTSTPTIAKSKYQIGKRHERKLSSVYPS